MDDVTVIEVTSYVAAPSAGAILADLGANVIRIEPLAGDPWRNQGRRPKLDDPMKGFDFQFTVSNRGKRSVAVDLTTEAGAALVQGLVAKAQVFMCNLLVHRQERFGLDPASLHAINPTLVHATLTGYGTTGPEAWRPGYDVTAFFARSGLTDASREGVEGVAPLPRPAQGDHTTGLAFFGAIMAALRHAERSGEGQVVETSLYEAAVWTQACDFSITAMDGAPVNPRPREQAVIATNNRFRCGDGKWLVITMPNPSSWPKLCQVLGKDEWADDERFIDLRSRFRNMAEIVAGIDEVLATRSRDEWGEIFDAERIIWGPVMGLDEVASDAQAEALGLFPEIEGTEVGTIRSVRAPMRIHDTDVGPRGPAPDLGEHTAEVLAEFGLDEDLDRLSSEGIVGLG